MGRERILKAGGEVMTLDQLALKSPLGKIQFYFKEEGQLARPTVISELLANPAHMLSLWFARREGNSNGLVVVVKAVVTRNKPKTIPSHCKKLENNIFVVTTHSE